MKKVLYYISPFIFFSLIYIADDLVRTIDFFYKHYEIVAILLIIMELLFTALIGSLSTSNKKFDYPMTLILPFSYVLSLFLALFCEEIYDCVRFSIHHALNIEYYKAHLPMIIALTAIVFSFSFKPIRLSKIFHSDNKKQLG